MSTSGSAAKTSVVQGTKIDFEVRSTGTIALVSVLRTLAVLLGLNTTDVLAALPLVDDLKFDNLLILNFASDLIIITPPPPSSAPTHTP